MKLAIIFASALTFSGCNIIDCLEGQGAMSTKTFEQSEFDSFELSSSADVKLIPSTRNAIEITTYENLFERIEIENEGGEIDVDFKGCVNMDKTMLVKVYFTKLSEVELTGSGNVTSSDTIRGDRFEIGIMGSGNIDIPLNVSTVEANINGSGDIVLSGTTGQFRGKINGSGNLRAIKLNSSSTDIVINGSGDADLGNCNNLTSKVNGSGNVNCQGK